MTGGGRRDRAFPGGAGQGGLLDWLGPGEPETLALIHATVELERALRELGVPVPARQPVPDLLLGARVLVVEVPGGSLTAVAEPSTEGRLAAFLARHGEGLAGRYVHSPIDLAKARSRAAGAGVTLSRVAEGPFGSAVLVRGGPIGGPHLILVAPTAVPSRP